MTAFGSIKEKNEKNYLYMFRFINHSVFDRRICVPIFYKKKLGMLRWVNYQNMQLQKNHVYDVLKSIESFLAYYFLMPFLGAATLMQIIRNGIAVGTKKNEK